MIVDELHRALDELAGPAPSPSSEQVANLLRAATRARRRRRGAVVVLSAIALAIAVSAGLLVRSESSPPAVQPAQVPPTTSGPVEPPRASTTVTVVGDTVMVGASHELEAALEDRFGGRATVLVRATDGMDAVEALQVLRTARDRGTLGETVVLQLGTNGRLDAGTLARILTVTDDADNVVVVNDKVPRDWESSNNRILADAVDQHDNALLVDWHAFGTSHPELFYDDGIHLTPTGAHRYAALVAESIKTTGTTTSRALRDKHRNG